MNNQQFFNCFKFYKISFCKQHHTDHISDNGSPLNYIGMMIHGRSELIGKTNHIENGAGDIFFIPKGWRYESFWYPDSTGSVEWYSLGFDLIPINENRYPVLQKIYPSDVQLALLNEITQNLRVDCKNIGNLYTFLSAVLETAEYAESALPTAADTAADLISKNPYCNISEIAVLCSVSESGLYGIFKKRFGITPNDYRQKALCDIAVKLLTTTDLSIETISNRLNFSSSSYFRKILKKHTNMTPSQIRKHSVV